MEMQSFLHHVGFTVSDLDRSIDFYTRILGFALKKRWEEGPELVEVGMGVPGAHLALAQLQGYGCTLELMQYVRAAGSTQPIAPNHIGVGHISLGLVDFEPFVQGLREQNVPFAAPVTRVRVGQWVFIEDPDGIRIELMGRIKT